MEESKINGLEEYSEDEMETEDFVFDGMEEGETDEFDIEDEGLDIDEEGLDIEDEEIDIEDEEINIEEDDLDSEEDDLEGYDEGSNDTEESVDEGEYNPEDYADGSEVDTEELVRPVDVVGDSIISSTGDIVVMDNIDGEENFKLIYVDINNIWTAKNRIRQNHNVDGLVRSIKSTGLINPVVVAPTATKGFYILIKGLRRLLACAKAGKRMVPCIVNLRISTPEIPILEAMYSMNMPYTIKEKVDFIEYLEKQKGIMSASMIEYLLQMDSGDYTKLKDILNDNDEDIVDKLYMGIFTIETAFKKLEQRRKKETAEERENRKAEKVYGDEKESGIDRVQGSGEEADESQAMSDVEIEGLPISASNIGGDESIEEIEQMMKDGDKIAGYKAHKQDPKYRERLDPALRKQVLARDNNTCLVCEVISGMEYTEVLDVHHIKEVYVGGNDAIDNLMCTCTVCHKLIHLYGRGELNIRPFEEMDELEQRKFKRIVKLGTKIRQDVAAMGMSKKDLKKLDRAETIGRTKPGDGQIAG